MRRMMPRRLYSVLLVAFQLGRRISIVSSVASSRVGAVTGFTLGSNSLLYCLNVVQGLVPGIQERNLGKPAQADIAGSAVDP